MDLDALLAEAEAPEEGILEIDLSLQEEKYKANFLGQGHAIQCVHVCHC